MGKSAVARRRIESLLTIQDVANRIANLLFPGTRVHFELPEWNRRPADANWSANQNVNRLLIAKRQLCRDLAEGRLVAVMAVDAAVLSATTADFQIKVSELLPPIEVLQRAEVYAPEAVSKDDSEEYEELVEPARYTEPYREPSFTAIRIQPNLRLINISAQAWEDETTVLDLKTGQVEVRKTHLSWKASRSDVRGSVTRQLTGGTGSMVRGRLYVVSSDKYFRDVGLEASALPENFPQRYSNYRRDWVPELIAAGWRHIALEPGATRESLAKAMMAYRNRQLPPVAAGRVGVTKGSAFPPEDKTVAILASNIHKQFTERLHLSSVLVPSASAIRAKQKI